MDIRAQMREDDLNDLPDPIGSEDARDYCPHGVYVGGCGIDYMCGICESE